MARKHMKRLSKLIIREIQTKPTMRKHHTLVRIVTIKKKKKKKSSEDV